MQRSITVGLVALVFASSAGCTVRDVEAGGAFVAAPAEVSTYAFSEPPSLVYVDPGVYVVENSDYPVYYVDDSYWIDRGGAWYRADYWDAPWIAVDVGVVPTIIEYRDHRRYEHYHGRFEDRRWREPREHFEDRRERREMPQPEPPRILAPPDEQRRRQPVEPAPPPRLVLPPMPAQRRPLAPPVAPSPAPRPQPVAPPAPPPPKVVSPPRAQDPRILTPRLIPPAAPPPPPKNAPRAAPQPSPAPPAPPPPTKTLPRRDRRHRPSG